MADNSIFLIDIDKIIKEKAGKKASRVPRFVVSYLKRIVHQDELNGFLRENSDKVGVPFLEACRGTLHLHVESSVGRSGWSIFGLSLRQALRWQGEISCQRFADESSWIGSVVHPYK